MYCVWLTVYNNLCKIKECKPNCGEDQGFQFLNSDNDLFINAQERNISHDLRLLYIFSVNYKTRSKSVSDSEPIQNSIETLLRDVYFTGTHGTKEQIFPLNDKSKIYNVTDAMNRLGDIIKKDGIPEVPYPEGSYGELHIYRDKTPMKFIKA